MFDVWYTDRYGEDIFFVIHTVSQVVVFATHDEQEANRVKDTYNNHPAFGERYAQPIKGSTV